MSNPSSKLSSLTDRLKSGGAQLSRTLTSTLTSVKDLLAAPTPESKLVDQATSPTLPSPDWGLNLRICSLINSSDVSAVDVVRSIKKKIGGTDPMAAMLGLELLEVCAMNCERVFGVIAAEKVLEDMVRVLEGTGTESGVRVRVLEMIRGWGESQELSYLPVFRQTYENLQQRGMSSHAEDDSLAPMHYPMETYSNEERLPPPENYPIPEAELHGASGTNLPYSYGSLSAEQKKEFLEVTRNSIEVLSSLMNSDVKPDLSKDDLTLSMLEKCRDSQPVLQRLVETTTDDEAMLSEALSLHDELQQVISKFENIEVSGRPQHESVESNPTDPLLLPAAPTESINLEVLLGSNDDDTGTRGSVPVVGDGESSSHAK